MKRENIHVIVTTRNVYALINYEEIIEYYKQPFYKKWFSNPPVKKLIDIENHEVKRIGV